MELFLGFLSWLDDTVVDIMGEGKHDRKPLKISTFSASSSSFEAADPRSGNMRLLFVADPFDPEDNSARALTVACLQNAGRSAKETIETCGAVEVEKWLSFVFYDTHTVNKHPKNKTRTKRNSGKSGKGREARRAAMQ